LALQERVSLIERSAQQVQAIAAASEEQASAGEEIRRAVKDISTFSTETLDEMSRSVEIISGREEQAWRLCDLVSGTMPLS